MKKIIVLIILCLFTSIVYGAELLNDGDNLVEYLQKNQIQYEKKIGSISSWPEGQAKFGAYDTKADGTCPIIIIVNDTFPIGVLQGVNSNAYNLLDLDGDGKLDTKTDRIFLPYWVVSKTSVNQTKNDNITEILDISYQGYQDDDGPMFSTFETMLTIDKYKNDVSLENRDLVYLIDFYTTYSQQMPNQSLNIITLLGDKLKERFNKEHPLILLYTLETHINLGQKEKAREVLKTLRKLDPEFIPGMVYEYQLETDKEKAQVLLADLKKNHGEHWIVNEL